MTLVPIPAEFQRRYYYLLNFERALDWLNARYGDLWNDEERAFLDRFPALPLPSRALVVRMLMRNGPLFRTSKLAYAEIGCPVQAAKWLSDPGYIDADPTLTLDEIFDSHTKAELIEMFPEALAASNTRKAELRDSLHAWDTTAQRYGAWRPASAERIFRFKLDSLCDRLRLMFFGNLHQRWSEFVLTDLGVFRYEQVAFDPTSRPFQSRFDIDVFLSLHAYRELLDAYEQIDGAPTLEQMIHEIEALTCGQPWLEQKRQKLLFRIGQYCERKKQWDRALEAYSNCRFPGARHRRLRVLEQSGFVSHAYDLALDAHGKPESEEEAQRVARMLPRLRRTLGLAAKRVERPRGIDRIELALPRPTMPDSVERVVREALFHPDAPVHYVENALINALFGLLCWDAIFAPLPGAFFHPFQRGPADLHAPDFHERRRDAFERCLTQLDTDEYKQLIRARFAAKCGVQSPFVHWGVLTGELLETALNCFPAAHLKLCFTRIANDVGSHRTGLPDLIRFWPTEGRYEMIEVKGPGDRLQDNQIRWLAYCTAHDIPVRVVHVRWVDDPQQSA